MGRGVKAFTLLGLCDSADPSEVKARWRELCRNLHPDRGGDAGEFHRMRKAYEVALQESMMPKPCPECQGSGKTQVCRGFNTVWIACEFCGGTGKS